MIEIVAGIRLYPVDLLRWGGTLLLVAGFVAPLVSISFCTRPAPRWLVQWRDFAIAILGARLVARDVVDLTINPWFVALIVLHLAIAQSFVAAYNIRCIFPPYSDTCQGNQPQKGKILRSAIIGGIVLLLLTGGLAHGQASDPCAGEKIPVGSAGLDYKGYCIVPEPEKGPVQGIFVRRVEDLGGVTVDCIVLIHASSGWKIADDECVSEVRGDFSTVAVGDGWHMALDEEG